MSERSFGPSSPERANGSGPSGQTPSLSQSAGVELGHALAARIASDINARALMIKGPVASMQGLRPPRISADIDVLVEPRSVHKLCAALSARGWHAPVTREVPRVLDLHSITLVHDEWPCAIDVHRSFPGLLAEPSDTFDALWGCRQRYEIAGQPVTVPSRAGMALILALHALRSPGEPRSSAEIARLTTTIREHFSSQELVQFLELASVCRSRWIIKDMLRGMPGVDSTDDATSEEKRQWRLNQLDAPDKSAFLWRTEAATAFSKRQLWRLWRAFWVRRADVPRPIVSQLPSRREHWNYQIARWRRGVRIFLDRGEHSR